jgi:hypothetical protein
MQPYLFPYKGYFDLIASVDKFVIYDDAKYMKNSFINRNYFPNLFTFRLKNHSDYTKINKCYFKDIEADKKDFINHTELHAERYLDLLEQKNNLAFNIALTLKLLCEDNGIETPFYFSSEIPHGKFVDGILDIVKYLEGDTYVNLPGGRILYNQDMFGDIKLEFINTIPSPSILCLLGKDKI